MNKPLTTVAVIHNTQNNIPWRGSKTLCIPGFGSKIKIQGQIYVSLTALLCIQVLLALTFAGGLAGRPS